MLHMDQIDFENDTINGVRIFQSAPIQKSEPQSDYSSESD